MAGSFDISIGMKAAVKAAGSSINFSSGDGGITFSVARVTYVLLDESNPEKFKKLGGWKGLGTIECQSFINNENENATLIEAKPINANITNYPVVNEVVLLIKTITYEAQVPIKNYKPAYYYTQIVNGWNAVEHNAIPSQLFFKDGNEKVTSLFNPKGDNRPLIKAPGDITIEGRSPNSIRLGSTVDGFNSKVKGEDRSSYLIITNNRATTVEKGTGSFENVNKDGSSLYMLEGHNIAFNFSSLNFDSYGEQVSSVEELNNNVVPIQKQDENPVVDNTTKDQAVIPTKDEPPVTYPVKTAQTQQTGSNQSVDDDILPDRETPQGEFFQETEDYIYDADEQEQTVLVSTEKIYVKTSNEQGQVSTVQVNKNAGNLIYDLSPLATMLKGKGYTNGNLNSAVLRNLKTADVQSNSIHLLHPIAASNWERLYSEARKSGVLFNISYLKNAAYRAYDQQKQTQQSAKKGFSPHGWGGAVDIQQLYTAQENAYKRITGTTSKPKYPCGAPYAREVRNTSPLYKWLTENGPKYGWYNPYRLADNAGNQDEAWHFEYWGPV